MTAGARVVALMLGGLFLVPTAHAGFKAKKASNAELVACLKDQPNDVKRDCMDFISDKAVVEAGDALAVLAKQGDDRIVRAHAIGTLEKLAAPQVTAAAIDMAVNDKEASNRSKALVVIQKVVSEADGAPVVVDRMANDPDEGVRRKALSVAKKVTWAGMDDAMINHGLTDDAAMVRRDALYGLLAVESEKARPAIYTVTQALPDAERKSTLRIWAKNPLAMDKDFLVAMLDDANEDVGIFAARALLALGDASVAPILRERGKAHGGDRKSEYKDAAKDLEKGG
jgi:hypothetical protein